MYDIDELLTTKQVAEVLGGIDPKMLENWRESGWGPPYRHSPRGRVLYRMGDVCDWFESFLPPSYLEMVRAGR